MHPVAVMRHIPVISQECPKPALEENCHQLAVPVSVGLYREGMPRTQDLALRTQRFRG